MPNPFRKKPTRTKAQQNAASSPKKSPAKKTRRPAARTKPKKAPKSLEQIVVGALDDLKAVDVHTLDVRHLTTVTDTTAGKREPSFRMYVNS